MTTADNTPAPTGEVRGDGIVQAIALQEPHMAHGVAQARGLFDPDA